MKFIDSWTNEACKVSTVEIEHMGKPFTDYAYCHPDDEWSEFTGCRIAETRATIQALKYERTIKIKKCEECRKFVKAVEQYKNFDKTSSTAKAMYRQLNRRIKEVNDLTDLINNIELNLKASIRFKNKLKTKKDNEN